jgi:hypothetical protein
MAARGACAAGRGVSVRPFYPALRAPTTVAAPIGAMCWSAVETSSVKIGGSEVGGADVIGRVAVADIRCQKQGVDPHADAGCFTPP